MISRAPTERLSDTVFWGKSLNHPWSLGIFSPSPLSLHFSLKSLLEACFQRALKYFCSHIPSVPHIWPTVSHQIRLHLTSNVRTEIPILLFQGPSLCGPYNNWPSAMLWQQTHTGVLILAMWVLTERGPQKLTDPCGVHGESILSQRCPQWPRVWLLPFETQTKVECTIWTSRELTLADLHDAHDDDEGEGQQLPGGEHVLNSGGPPHAGAVHPCQQHYMHKNTVKHRVRWYTVYTSVISINRFCI